MVATTSVTLQATYSGLVFKTPFHRYLVDDLKAQIPPAARKWDPVSKYWVIDPKYGGVCARLALRHLGVEVKIPFVEVDNRPKTMTLDVLYVGRCYRRDWDASATGAALQPGASIDDPQYDWMIVFPEQTLRAFFKDLRERPGQLASLYAILGVEPNASEDEINRAHRRRAKMWHPDVASEEKDAAEVFKRIQSAYEILSDRLRRKKYDAALRFEALSTANNPRVYETEDDKVVFIPPLRCGRVTAKGREQTGRFVVSEILEWSDIEQGGRMLVTAWDSEKKTITVRWR